MPAAACPPFVHACAPPLHCRSDKEKETELADMDRVGHARVKRVGPAAARQLLSLLRCDNPNLRIKAGEAGEAGA